MSVPGVATLYNAVLRDCCAEFDDYGIYVQEVIG
jgi:hypothetical protein